MLVLIGKLSLSTLKWVPICQGFGDFSGFLHYFVLAELATSSIRVKSSQYTNILNLQFSCSYRPGNIYITKLLFNISADYHYQDKLNKNTNILEKEQFKIYQMRLIPSLVILIWEEILSVSLIIS